MPRRPLCRTREGHKGRYGHERRTIQFVDRVSHLTWRGCLAPLAVQHVTVCCRNGGFTVALRE